MILSQILRNNDGVYVWARILIVSVRLTFPLFCLSLNNCKKILPKADINNSSLSLRFLLMMTATKLSHTTS